MALKFLVSLLLIQFISCRLTDKEFETLINQPLPPLEFCKDSVWNLDLCVKPKRGQNCTLTWETMDKFIYNRTQEKCFKVNMCCPQIVGMLMFDDKDGCERFCKPDEFCTGEDVTENCVDWQPFCFHGKNMYVLDKDGGCKKLTKCCPYNRYLFETKAKCLDHVMLCELIKKGK